MIKLVSGIISAKASFYKFFEDLCTYTEDPKKEIEKIFDLTNGGNLEDILVKCCGLSKMGVSGTKTICTANKNANKEFEEYICRGWKIDLIDPIVVDKEGKTIKEVKLNSIKEDNFCR